MEQKKKKKKAKGKQVRINDSTPNPALKIIRRGYINRAWRRMKRNLINLVIVTVVAGIMTSVTWYRSYRNREINHLYAVATGAVLSDSGTATMATKKSQVSLENVLLTCFCKLHWVKTPRLNTTR